MTSIELEAGAKRWLLDEAEKITEQAPAGKDQASQLRNLMQIAQRESDVKVLSNFIRYQVGRTTTRAFWQPIHGKVIRVLEEIQLRVPPEARGVAVQSFFAFMLRHYVYLRFLHERDRERQPKPRREAR